MTGNEQLHGEQSDVSWKEHQVRQEMATNIKMSASIMKSVLTSDAGVWRMKAHRGAASIAFCFWLVCSSAMAADSAPPDFSDLSIFFDLKFVLNKFLNDAKIEHWETATRILCQFYPKNHLLSPALINIFNGNRLGI